MEYRTLGSTGTIVSTQCLGTMTFGNESDEATAHEQLDLFVELAATSSTPPTCTRAASPRRSSAAGCGPPDIRDQIVIATKGRFPMGDGPNDAGLSRAPPRPRPRRQPAPPRRRHHRPLPGPRLGPADPDRGDARLLRRRRARRQDPLRGRQQLRRLAAAEGGAAGRSAASPIVTLQPQYNLLVRDIELEIVDVCRNEGIGILPWSPLAGGWLTGKYARDEAPSGATRLGEDPDRGMEAYGPRNAQERTWRVIDAVATIADGRGVSMSQVALAWLADRPAVTSVILGARTIAQLERQPRRRRPAPVAGGDGAAQRGQRPAGVRLSLRPARHRPARPRA